MGRTVPLWGIWHENRVHLDGSPQTGWAQNLVRNPQVAVHLPDAEKVMIIYGDTWTIEDDQEWSQPANRTMYQ